VGGNGGMRPRHARLLAQDLDRATVVRFIDRFLMFYVRTADRLQRTSTWCEGLEGGMDYLRAVVVDDKLGIASELEADMRRVTQGYACEWKTAVEDPQTRRRFRHFVNVEEPDPNLAFVPERGQFRPASDSERQTIIPIARVA
jgi:nitrite reductase (NADH) large subunit